MPAFRAETTIARPRPAVFRYAADLENQPNWLLSVVSVRRLSGGRGLVGSTYEQSIREEDGITEYALEVTEVEPGERFVYVSQGDYGHSPPVRVEYRFSDEEGGSGGTTVALVFHIRMGPFFRLFWPLAIGLRRNGRRQIGIVLGRLKLALESRAPSP